MPLKKQYDETKVLDRAMHAFWARGYSATSVGDLVQATGINRASLYAAYDGKGGLFAACLRRYDAEHRQKFLDDISAAYPPRAAIMAAFRSAAEPGKTPGGCLLVNTALEVSPHDPEIRALVNDSLGAVETFFRDNIAAAQSTGQMRADIDPDQTAKSLLGLFLGLRVMMRSGLDKTAVSAVIQQAGAMLA